MKKLFILFAIIVGSAVAANAQEIGGRWGGTSSGGNAFAIDVTYQTGASRTHLDVAFNNGVGIDLLWDFLYKPLGGEAFNWYVGAGPYVFIGDDFKLGAVVEGGLEYHFKFPLALGVDYRPSLEIIDDFEWRWGGWGFNARYVIGGRN